MKVLMVHNYYQSSAPSGENIVFENEVKLLKSKGIDVVTYVKKNDEILNYTAKEKFLIPFRTIWSQNVYAELRELIKKEKPDIVHFHNIWYLISPSAYYACKELGVPTVQTLHNYRIFCTNGMLYRNNSLCELCIPNNQTAYLKFILNALRYKCYRNSILYSLPVALTQTIHWLKKTWQDTVDAYITLTEYSKNKFIRAGIPRNKIFVKPNFLFNEPNPNYTHKNYAVFVGRLTHEKGVFTLIEAIKYLTKVLEKKSFYIKIIGDGPLKNFLEDSVKSLKLNNIEFLGKQPHDIVISLISNSKFVIVPSWVETFSMVVLEAFACGKPVIASNIGVLMEIIKNGETGLTFEVGNPIELAEKISYLIQDDDICHVMGIKAREEYEVKYTPDRSFDIIMDIYSKLMK